MKSIGIIGLGRMGAALAYALALKGLPLTALASRDRQKAEKLAKTIGQSTDTHPQVVAIEDMAKQAEIIFIATPDDAIAANCARVTWDASKTAVHLSGAQTLSVLEAASQEGAHVGSFHPLNSFAPSDCARARELYDKALVLKVSYIGLAGSDAECLSLLESLAHTVGAGHFLIAEEHRALYHLTAVMASNFLTTLVATSVQLWQQMGYDAQAALEYMAPLVRSASHNTLELGPVAALTGPIARGDSGTVHKHLRALAELPDTGQTARLYHALAMATLPLAVSKGSLDEARYRQILNLLQTEEQRCVK